MVYWKRDRNFCSKYAYSINNTFFDVKWQYKPGWSRLPFWFSICQLTFWSKIPEGRQQTVTDCTITSRHLKSCLIINIRILNSKNIIHDYYCVK